MKKLFIGLLALLSISSFASECKVSTSQLTELEKETLHRSGVNLFNYTSDLDAYYEMNFEENIYYLTGDSKFLGANSMGAYSPARKQAKVTLFKVTRGYYSDIKEVIKTIKGSKLGLEGRVQGTSEINVDNKMKRYRAKIIKKLIEICS